MKKAIAFISAILVIISLVPMDAFADSSVALPQFVFSLMFQSVTTPSFVDVTNYNAATDTTTSSSTVSLANSVGSYSQINRTGIPIAQNLICVKFSVVSPSAHFFDDITIEPYINGYPAHLYGTYTQSDYNNQIDYYMFFYIGEDSHRVKDGSGQDITPWGIRITTNAVRNYAWNYSSSTTYFYYYNYTLQSQTVDPGEAADLALNIINVLQLSQLSENLGMINTQLDTGNIASMMESMLTYLAQIPDILTYIDQIETNQTSIINAINYFKDYYNGIYSDIAFSTIDHDLYYWYQNNYVSSTGNPTSTSFMTCIDLNNIQDSFIYSRQSFYYYSGLGNDLSLSVSYFLTNQKLNSFDFNSIQTYSTNYNIITSIDHSNNNYVFYYVYSYIPEYYKIASRANYCYIIYTFNHNIQTYYSSPRIFAKSLKYSYFDRIVYYLQSLLNLNSSVPSDIQQTTDNINQNATAVNNFQSNTQQSLDQDLQNVPVADYQIQATTGTQYMKAYSEALFNASNGFRIWFMLPLILFLIGMLIRWGIKK